MRGDVMMDLSQKLLLTIQEASEYSNVGQHKIRELVREPDCVFLLCVGNKNLIKRKKFAEYLMEKNVI